MLGAVLGARITEISEMWSLPTRSSQVIRSYRFCLISFPPTLLHSLCSRWANCSLSPKYPKLTPACVLCPELPAPRKPFTHMTHGCSLTAMPLLNSVFLGRLHVTSRTINFSVPLACLFPEPALDRLGGYLFLVSYSCSV